MDVCLSRYVARANWNGFAITLVLCSEVFAEPSRPVFTVSIGNGRIRHESLESLVPKWRPLELGGDYIVCPDLNLTHYGVNVADGRRWWKFPWDVADDNIPAKRRTATIRHSLMNSRTGEFSLNGDHYFAIQRGNQLASIDWKLEGKLRWLIGENTDTEPTTKVLGVPCVANGRLFVLLEQRRKILLAELSPETGEINKRLELEGETADFALQRFSPIVLADRLVCPLPSGNMIAVDIDLTAVAWRHETLSENQLSAGFRLMRAEQNRIIIHARDGVYCIDASGRQAWHHRCDSLVVPHEDVVFLDVENKIQAIRLSTGTREWQRKLATDEKISGNGVTYEDYVLVPVNRTQILFLSTSSGNVRSRLKTKYPLGNLFAFKNSALVFSLSTSKLAAYSLPNLD